MQNKGVDITIGPDGNVEKIEAFGFAGKGCIEATEPLEKVLGKVTNRVSKPEMNQRQPLQRERHTQRN
jgi:hypothetical protein